MQRLISFLILLSAFIVTQAQRLNEHCQKVVKEIYVAGIDKHGQELPKERYIYAYDKRNRLIGITKQEYRSNELEANTPAVWFVSDSIYLVSGKLNRFSYYYDSKKHRRVPTGYTYTYTLNSDHTIAKVVSLLHHDGGSVSKNNHNFWYEKVPNSNRTRLIKYDSDEWWLPEDEKEWYRQCWPKMRLIDYASGVWAFRAVDKTIEEMIASRQRLVDFSTADDLNIDISGILNDNCFYYNSSFRCESMTEWLPRRLDYYPLDRINLTQYRSFVFDKDADDNVIEVKGYWKSAKDSESKQTLLVRIKYL